MGKTIVSDQIKHNAETLELLKSIRDDLRRTQYRIFNVAPGNPTTGTANFAIDATYHLTVQ